MRLILECQDTGMTVFVNDRELYPGVVLDREFGMTGTVSERLMRIIALLALRRIDGVNDGWTDVSEIASLVDRTNHARVPSPSGVAKFFERLLRYRSKNPEVLIKYEQTRSRGRYRLALPPRDIVIRDSNHPSGEILPSDILLVQGILWMGALPDSTFGDHSTLDVDAALEVSEVEFRRGNLPMARHVVARATQRMMRGEGVPKSPKDSLALLARAYERIAYLDMEMGQSNAAQRGATAALQFYRRIKDRAGSARVLQINAHAHRQLGRQSDAVRLASMSLRASKQSRRTKRGLEQAGFLGVLGQQLTYDGMGWKATKNLEDALQLAEAAGDMRWTACWQLRLVENALSLGQLTHAERYLGRAIELHTRLPHDNIPHEALMYRISAQFFLASGSLAEARVAILKAHDIGVAHAMSHQIRAMTPLLAYLENES